MNERAKNSPSRQNSHLLYLKLTEYYTNINAKSHKSVLDFNAD